MANEYAIELATSNIRYGFGVTRELGMDLAERRAHMVMVVTDPHIAKLAPLERTLESLEDNDISWKLFDRVKVEPTDQSFHDAIVFAETYRFDARRAREELDWNPRPFRTSLEQTLAWLARQT